MSDSILPGLAAVALLLVVGAGAVADEAVVSGTASYRERLAMPSGVVFEAILEDVSVADAPADVLARVVQGDAGQPPYRFTIPYDPALLEADHRYSVRARVSVDGELEFASDRQHPVLTGGASDHVEVMMMRAAGERGPEHPRARPARATAAAATTATVASSDEVDAATPALKGLVTYLDEEASFTDCRSGRDYPVSEDGEFEALVHAYLAAGREPGAPIMVSFEGAIEELASDDEDGGEAPTVFVERFVGVWPDLTCEQVLGDATLKNTVWVIESLGVTEVAAAAGRVPQLLLDGADLRFSASVGCNRLAGAFEADEGRLRFEPAAATQMGCAPPLDAWERALGDILGRTASWRIEGDTLELLDAAGAPIAILVAQYHY